MGASDAGSDLFAGWPELDGLSPTARAALTDAARRLRFDAADTVFTMGQEDGSALYLVEAGAGRLTRADGERGDIAVEEVRAGDPIGLAGFARNENRLADAALQAIGPMTLIEIDAYRLREIGNEDGAVAMALLALLARSKGTARRQDDPRARVFRHLLSLVRQNADGRTIPEMPRHAALAEAAGVTDVEAAGAVADLIAKGIAKRAYPGLEVLDSEGLHRAAFV